MKMRATPTGEMDHESLQSSQIPDRYLMGKLSAEERSAFEEHFLDCPICLENLESLEGLRAGLRELSPRELPAARQVVRHASVRPWRDPRAAALLAAACLALAVLTPALFFGELRRTRGELENARRTTNDAQREKVALTQALERQRTERARVAGIASGIAPMAASVFTLNRTRGSSGGVPDSRIVLRDSREWIIFLVDRPAPPDFGSYQARISTPDRRPIGDPVAANAASGEMLAVGLPPGLLHAGDFILSVEGLGPGSARELATYRFRALLKK